MHAIPTEAQRKLVRAQFARMEEPIQLHAREVRPAELLEFITPVLVNMPGIV